MYIVEIISEWIEKLTPLFSMLIAVLTWITGLLQSKLIKRLKLRKREKLLSIKNDEICEVILPVRSGIIEQRMSESKVIKDPVSNDYITLEESRAMLVLPDLLQLKELRLVNGKGDTDIHNCKFCIGGFQANEYVKHLMRGNLGVRFNGKVIRGSSQATLDHPAYSDCRDFLKLRGENHAIYIGNYPDLEEYVYNGDGDYVVWLKVSPDDFGQKNHGAVHAIWGDLPDTPAILLKYIQTDINDIYRMLKKNGHLKHFCLLMKRTSTGEIDFNSIMDYTDKVFKTGI